MKIAVFGLGFVGLSNTIVMAQHNEVTADDITSERVDLLDARKLPIGDAELEGFLAPRPLSLTTATDPQQALAATDYVIVVSPTNYDVDSKKSGTSSVEAVLLTIKTSPIRSSPRSQGWSASFGW